MVVLRSVLVGACLLALLAATPVGAAHVPASGSGGTPEDAFVIEDATRSWAVYASLPTEGGVAYYAFDLHEGDTLFVQLFASDRPSNEGFAPTLVVVGPGLEPRGVVPAGVEVPEGAAAVVLAPDADAPASAEGFAPHSLRELATLDAAAPESGRFLVAVHADAGGHFGLAVGKRESFTPLEWVLVPLDLVGVYAWDGQRAWVSLAPLVVTMIVGGAAIASRSPRPHSSSSVLAAVAGLLLVGSGLVVWQQVAVTAARAGAEPALLVALVRGAVPLALGAWALALARRLDREPTRRVPAALAAVGVLGVLAWGGFLVGPALAVAAAAAAVAPRHAAARPQRS